MLADLKVGHYKTQEKTQEPTHSRLRVKLKAGQYKTKETQGPI